ncbi:MAG: C40 family peptidase [Flavobacteriaceae bacterium]|nr:C40 family peptidase [Flavobacteriaceae bacterium]
MRKIFLIFLLTPLFFSCGSKQAISNKVHPIETTRKTNTRSTEAKIEKIIEVALSYEGTRYRYGGTTRKGMDCSGLVYTAFETADIPLPRISRDMANRGERIRLEEAYLGDLLFFQTNKNRKVINHVGLIVENDRGQIRFIHSTTSRGVIISSLEERYWKSAYIEARRII